MLLNMINVDRFLPIQIDITNACNLKCVHCYHPHHKNEGAISLDDWKAILLQYKKLILKMKYRPWVAICGGEPLVSPNLMPILNFIKKDIPGSTIIILTNGTLINEKIIEQLKSFDKIQFQVSLDGPDALRHDSIRGSGNFDRALNGIDLLQKNGFKVNVLSVLSQRTNLWMEDFFKLAKEKKFNSMNFVRFVSEGFGRSLLNNNQDKPLLGLELRSAYQNLIRFITKHQVKSATQGPLFELLVPGLGRNGRFWESIVIDYQGYVVASSRSNLRLGHAINDGIENLFLNHTISKALRTGKVEVCGNCEHFSVCGGDRNAAYAATGNFLAADPGCWKEEIEQKLTGVI